MSLRAEILHGDCLKIIPSLSGVGMIITDPPYGIAHPCNFNSRGRSNLARCNDYPDVLGDDKPYDPAPILALDVPTVLWGANHYADKLPPTGGWLVWDKDRGDDLDQSTCELAWTNYIKGVRRFRHLWDGFRRASEQHENYHPTQKPVALTTWILGLRWTPRLPLLILDPYCGAAGSGVAAIYHGASFVGIEQEVQYVDIARKRIAIAATRSKIGLVTPAKGTALGLLEYLT